MLFERQVDTLSDKAADAFLGCLDQMKSALHSKAIPDFDQLNEVLRAASGFEVVVVKGLIPVVEFFELLANRQFPSSTWMRTMEQLDYLAEPDMFHDIFGHIPLLMNDEYARFMQRFGEIGAQNGHDEALVKRLQRLYWFTIEFGMIQQSEGPRIYGAGIMSSFKESNYVFEPQINYHPFDIEHMMETDFDYTDIQKDYFVIDDFDQLYDGLEVVQRILPV